jgi:hypothetical protein
MDQGLRIALVSGALLAVTAAARGGKRGQPSEASAVLQ